MSFGMFQKSALKKFVKNYIKALPFDLSNDECLGFSASLVKDSMVSYFSYNYMNDYEKFQRIREQTEFETINIFSKSTNTPIPKLKLLIEKTFNIVQFKHDSQLNDHYFREVNELPNYESALITKERVSKLYEEYKNNSK